MRKVVLTFGLLAGIIVTALMFVNVSLSSKSQNFDNGEWLGYTSMIIALSMIFFGVRQYRDRYLNGHISFGKAFLAGLYISLIASALYVIGWELYSPVFFPDFMNKYSAHMIEKVKASGASAEKIQEAIAEMQKGKEYYANPLFRIPMVFMEIFPVGLVVSLICAAILRKKPKPVQEQIA